MVPSTHRFLFRFLGVALTLAVAAPRAWAQASSATAPDSPPLDETARNDSPSSRERLETAGQAPGEGLVIRKSDSRPTDEGNAPVHSGVTLSPASSRTPWYRRGWAALAIVLVMVGAGFWGVRRFLPNARVKEGALLGVAARTVLSPKHSVALLKVGARRYVLVGLTPDRISPLCAIEREDEVADLALRSATDKDDVRFRGALGQALERSSREADGAADAPNGVSQARGQLDSLLRHLKTLREEDRS